MFHSKESPEAIIEESPSLMQINDDLDHYWRAELERKCQELRVGLPVINGQVVYPKCDDAREPIHYNDD